MLRAYCKLLGNQESLVWGRERVNGHHLQDKPSVITKRCCLFLSGTELNDISESSLQLLHGPCDGMGEV